MSVRQFTRCFCLQSKRIEGVSTGTAHDNMDYEVYASRSFLCVQLARFSQRFRPGDRNRKRRRLTFAVHIEMCRSSCGRRPLAGRVRVAYIKGTTRPLSRKNMRIRHAQALDPGSSGGCDDASVQFFL